MDRLGELFIFKKKGIKERENGLKRE